MLVPFDIAPRGPGETLRAVGAMVEALTVIDLDQVSALPPLLDSGVRYRFPAGRDPCGVPLDRWRDARTVYARREGDCEDLASWLAAELRRAGHEARAFPFYVSPRLIHVVVLSQGRILDPSVALGMSLPPGFDPASYPALVDRALALGV